MFEKSRMSYSLQDRTRQVKISIKDFSKQENTLLETKNGT